MVEIPVSDVDFNHSPYPGRPTVLAQVSFTLYGTIRFTGARIVRRNGGRLLLNFPDTPISATCFSCEKHVGITSRFCSRCGAKQPLRIYPTSRAGNPVRFHEVVHPVSAPVRLAIETAILRAYDVETGAVPAPVIPDVWEERMWPELVFSGVRRPIRDVDDDDLDFGDDAA